MEDVRQTKEEFIKSMVLFIVLLVICFTPFFAFSQAAGGLVQANAAMAFNDAIADPDLSDASQEIRFELIRANQLKIEFSTSFKCAAYAIEGRSEDSKEYFTVLYCKDAQCMDPRNTVYFNFGLKEHPYVYYRVKTTLLNGNVVYSAEKKAPAPRMNPLELVNTAVSDKLYLKLNVPGNYTYTICNIKGECLYSDETLNADGVIDLSNREAGFYIIRFTSANGQTCHYKFFKTVNL